MRFACQRCGRNYTIADELRGKAFKMRCRACGHTIVVRGAPGPGPSSLGASVPDRPAASSRLLEANPAVAAAPPVSRPATSPAPVPPSSDVFPAPAQELRAPGREAGLSPPPLPQAPAGPYIDLVIDEEPAGGGEGIELAGGAPDAPPGEGAAAQDPFANWRPLADPGPREQEPVPPPAELAPPRPAAWPASAGAPRPELFRSPEPSSLRPSRRILAIGVGAMLLTGGLAVVGARMGRRSNPVPEPAPLAPAVPEPVAGPSPAQTPPVSGPAAQGAPPGESLPAGRLAVAQPAPAPSPPEPRPERAAESQLPMQAAVPDVRARGGEEPARKSSPVREAREADRKEPGDRALPQPAAPLVARPELPAPAASGAGAPTRAASPAAPRDVQASAPVPAVPSAAPPAPAPAAEPIPSGPTAGVPPPPAPPRELSAGEITRVVSASREAFARCVADALDRDPGLDLGGRDVLLTLTVAPSGKVVDPALDDAELGRTELGSCLKNAARLMVFPSFAGEPLRVEVPLALGP